MYFENEENLTPEEELETAEAREDAACDCDDCTQCEGGCEGEIDSKEMLTQLMQALAAQQENLLRTTAEYENFRKRSAKEKDAAFSNGMGYAVTALLPVLDTLDMAAAAPTEDENFKKGVLLTLEKCEAAFKTLGAQEIPALGEKFDPQFHAALAQSEEGEPGTVTGVLQKGYTLGDKVLRHAGVMVAKS